MKMNEGTILLCITEMSMAALPLPSRTRGSGSGSLFFITVAARRGSFQKKKI
jgi:hypothetical protein